MMKEMRLQCPVPLMSRVLDVSASGYYAWLERPQSKRAQEEARLEVEIKAAHKRTRQTCGPERLQHDLAEHGVQAGVCRIRRIRKKPGIRCKQNKRFEATTDSKHTLPVAQNVLDQQFEVSGPNTAWVSDITYVPTDEGWLYLAGHKDLFTAEIVGYAMGARMTKSLVSECLFKAVAAKRPAKGLIHHSDRGSQYCAHEYRKLLNKFGMRASMSGKGNCYDNAPMESGGHSNRSLSITAAIEAGKRRFRRLQNISRSSITGSADRQDLGSCPLWHMSKSSTLHDWLYEGFGVHY